MSLDFTEALDINTDDIERPPLPPIGHYTWQITDYALGEINSNNGSWDTVDFTVQCIEAMEDVDPDKLEDAGGVASIRLRQRFMYPKGTTPEDELNKKRTLSRLKMFLVEHCGMESGKLKTIIAESKGCTFLADIRHRPNRDDPENPFAELGRTAPVS